MVVLFLWIFVSVSCIIEEHCSDKYLPDITAGKIKEK